MRAIHALLVAGALLFFPSCSLLGLDQFDTPSCTTDAQCDRRNQVARLNRSECLAYRCRPNGAMRSCIRSHRDDDGDTAFNAVCAGGTIRGAVDCDDTNPLIYPDGLSRLDAGTSDAGVTQREQCDGVDNDCDSVIDENVLALESGTTWTPMGAAQHMSIAPGALMVTLMTTADDAESPANRLSSVYDDPGEFSALDALIPCTQRIDDGACNVRETSLDGLGEGSAAMAFISTNGCDEGRLHLRRLVGDTILAPGSTSNIAQGVRTTDIHDACTRDGARRPVLSALFGETASEPRALLTWIDSPVVGISWVRALLVQYTDDIVALGDPAGIRLGQTTIDATPVVLETGTDGWFVLALNDARVHIAFVSDSAATPALETDLQLPESMHARTLSATSMSGNRAALVLRGADNSIRFLVVALAVSSDALEARVVFGPARVDDGAIVPRSTASVIYRHGGFLNPGGMLAGSVPAEGPGGLVIGYMQGANPDHVQIVRIADNLGRFNTIDHTSLPVGEANGTWDFALYQGGERARLNVLRGAAVGASMRDAAFCGAL